MERGALLLVPHTHNNAPYMHALMTRVSVCMHMKILGKGSFCSLDLLGHGEGRPGGSSIYPHIYIVFVLSLDPKVKNLNLSCVSYVSKCFFQRN